MPRFAFALNPMIWQTTRYRIDLGRPRVMGIVNVTPDSFSGGSHPDTRAALAHCEQLLRDGADILDLGAESTRPGATPRARRPCARASRKAATSPTTSS